MNQRTKIGLVGYYGWGNYGDELFSRSLHDHFPNFEFVYFHDPLNGRFFDNYLERLESVSAVIIGGGDLIIPWYLSWLYWDENLLKKPVFIHGVGVPTWGGEDAAVIDKLRTFLSHSSVKHISCRDKESAEWVKTRLSPDVEVSNFPDIVCTLRDHLTPTVSDNCVTFIGRANNPIGSAVKKCLERLNAQGFRIKHLMLGTGSTLQADFPTFQELGELPRDIIVRDNEVDLLTEIKASSLVLSTKFHGCVSAFMSAVPSVSLSRADKFTSFYSATGLSDTVAGLEGAQLDAIVTRLLLEPFSFDARKAMFNGAVAGLNELGRAIQNEVGSANA
jgi:polysaccharide pyruvyl transferase WcaK-like protein